MTDEQAKIMKNFVNLYRNGATDLTYWCMCAAIDMLLKAMNCYNLKTAKEWKDGLSRSF